MEQVYITNIQKYTQIVQIIKNNLYNVMEFLYSKDSGHIVYSITRYCESCAIQNYCDCCITTDYYRFIDKSITVCNALKLLGFSTNINITYSEEVDVRVKPVDTKQYLNREIRYLPLSQFTII
jgi:hypothetical protein